MKIDINKIRYENPTIDAAIPILEMLSTKGHIALIVGGCVRDLVMGNIPKDIDIATKVRKAAPSRSVRFRLMIS